jgi:hypothetical protein
MILPRRNEIDKATGPLTKYHGILTPVYSTDLEFPRRGSEDVDVGLLGCNVVWTRREIPTFRRNILSSSSRLKMKAERFSEALVSTYKSTRHYSPKHQHRHFTIGIDVLIYLKISSDFVIL